MENKINVAKLIKDCPKGMELDCTMYNNVTFIAVENTEPYPIKLLVGSMKLNLTKSGCYSNTDDAKCVIFPKGKTTWEGFVPPCKFKDGDILANNNTVFIYNGFENSINYGTYAIIDNCGVFSVNILTKKYASRFATEKEKAKLFQAIKDNGYEWNTETKILTRLKHNINNFKPFDKVLVRDNNANTWRADFYSHYESGQYYWYVCIGDGYNQCIPYNEETANLIGTTNDCPDKYKTWKNE